MDLLTIPVGPADPNRCWTSSGPGPTRDVVSVGSTLGNFFLESLDPP
jgi:hypothetical protein